MKGIVGREAEIRELQERYSSERQQGHSYGHGRCM